MKVGDRIRLSAQPACRILGVPEDQIGVVMDVEAGYGRTAVLIRFPRVDVYTSALEDGDVEVIPPDTKPGPSRGCGADGSHSGPAASERSAEPHTA